MPDMQNILNTDINQSVKNLYKTSDKPKEILKNIEELGAEIVQTEANTDYASTLWQQQQAKAQREKMEKLANDYKEKRTKLEEQQNWDYPEFHPTQTNLTELATTFSLVGILGGLLGGSGRNAGMNALSAMDGMMQGWREGDKQRFLQEKTVFDENLKVMKEKNDGLQKRIDNLLSEYTSDRQKFNEDYALLAAENPYAAKLVQLKGVKGLLDLKKSVFDGGIKLEELSMKQRELAIKEAKERRAEAGGGALPKDTKTNDEHRFRHGAIENVKDVLNDLQNPEVRKLIGPYNKFTPDVLLNLRKGYPELAQKLARFQAQEFQIGGKSLTVSEQRLLGPIYNWRDKTAGQLEDNLKEALRQMDREQSYLEGRYPGLSRVNYGDTVTQSQQTKSSSIEEERKNANNAIANGADKNAVAKRFKQNTGQDL